MRSAYRVYETARTKLRHGAIIGGPAVVLRTASRSTPGAAGAGAFDLERVDHLLDA